MKLDYELYMLILHKITRLVVFCKSQFYAESTYLVLYFSFISTMLFVLFFSTGTNVFFAFLRFPVDCIIYQKLFNCSHYSHTRLYLSQKGEKRGKIQCMNTQGHDNIYEQPMPKCNYR